MSPAATLPSGRSGERPPARRASARRAPALVWIAAALVVAAAAVTALFLRKAAEYRTVQADLDRAAAACRAAREADARTLAPDDWLRATTRMDEAMAELHRQDGRFVLIRDYPLVHKLLADATDAADVARTSAVEAAVTEGSGPRHGDGTRVTLDAGDKLAAKAAIDATKGALARTIDLFVAIVRCPRAKRARELTKDLEQCKVNLEAMKQQVADLDWKYAREQFDEAKAAADTLKGALQPIERDLGDIKTKFKCR